MISNNPVQTVSEESEMKVSIDPGSLEAAALAYEARGKASPFYVHASQDPQVWTLRERRESGEVVVAAGDLTAMIGALREAKRINTVTTILETYLAAEKVRGVAMMPREPSHETLLDGCAEFDKGNGVRLGATIPKNIWQAMFDAAEGK